MSNWMKTARRYVRILCLTTVVVFFLYRTFVVNNAGYSKCSSMMSYGHWTEENTWSSPMCISKKYTDEIGLRDCLSKDVSLLMIGGEVMKILFRRITLKLTESQTENSGRSIDGGNMAQFVDEKSNINVTFYHQNTREADSTYQKLLDDPVHYRKRTVTFQQCETVQDFERSSGEPNDMKGVLKQLTKKQKLFLKRSPLSAIFLVPMGTLHCADIFEEIYSSSPVINVAPLNVYKISPDLRIDQSLDLLLNTFCNELVHDGGNCCIAKHRTSAMNIVIGILTLVIAFYAGMKMLLVTDTLRGLLPLMGVSFPKGQKGIGEYTNHPLLQMPNRMGAVAIVTTYLIVSTMSYLLMEGLLVMTGWDILPLLVLACVVVLGSVQYEEGNEEVCMSDEMVKEGKGLVMMGILFMELSHNLVDPLVSYVILRQLSTVLIFLFSFECFVTFVNSDEWTTTRMSQVLLRILLLPVLMWAVLTNSSFILNVVLFIFVHFTVVVFFAYLFSSVSGSKGGSGQKSLFGQILRPVPLVSTLVAAFLSFFVSSQVLRISIGTGNGSGNIDLTKWELDLVTDFMSVFYGMVVGVMVVVAKNIKGLSSVLQRLNKWAIIGISILICTICTTLTALFILSLGTRQTYPWMNYLFSPLLICSYTLTRNSVPYLRCIHSNFLSALGNVAYEVFLLYHCVFFTGEDKHMLFVFPHSRLVNIFLMFSALVMIASWLGGVYSTQSSPKTGGEKTTRAQA